MPDAATTKSLLDAVDRYFELMYAADVSRFEDVFAETSQLHGLRDGNLKRLPANDFKAMLASGPSAQANNAPRHQEVLLVDFASPTQAMVKVRVRMDRTQYIDYLSYHLINGAWLITAKSFHIERTYEPVAS